MTYISPPLITYFKNDLICKGIILGLDNEGRLIVKENNEVLYINSGEIKIKR